MTAVGSKNQAGNQETQENRKGKESRRDAKRAKEEKQSPTIQPAAFVGQEWLKNETFPPGTLDRAVDRAYRPAPFDSERARVEFLFERYQALTTLFPEKPKKRPRRAPAGA